ncbi:MAG: glutamate-5-semialdehyde dehydrogenase [Alphaproteobacteria bacterium]|nr:glutamate-5-semialdehyde dehydrogenase [Alphaproteobacteria bacterium]
MNPTVAPVRTAPAGEDAVRTMMAKLAAAARTAAASLARTPTEAKDEALRAAAAAIRERRRDILAANMRDLDEASGLTDALLDRLRLDDDRVEGIAASLEQVAALPDPVGSEAARWFNDANRLDIARVRVPLGVIGIIYESRPNVTADAGALCLKSGNAVILRGGSESFHSSHALVEALGVGLRSGGLDPAAVQMVPTTDRAAAGLLITESQWIDVVVPRGGPSLIERVQRESRVPVLAHLEGLCHTYIDRAADPAMAADIVHNGKMRRTSVCGATETVLCHRDAAGAPLSRAVAKLLDSGCEVRGDADVQRLDPRVVPALPADWDTEYLDAIVSIRVVDDLGAAIEHIRRHGSDHTDAIVTADPDAAERFLQEVDSAIVLHNASTQFADGGEFGMGAEIGISTGRLHARGPVGLEQLTTFKYVVRGQGGVRP